MTSSRSRDGVARITIDKRSLDTLMARLESELNAQRVLVAMPAFDCEPQATTGQGETDYVNVGTERQVSGALSAHAHRALDDIVSALDRFEEGTYGACTRCQRPIDAARLRALPRVELCIDCQRAVERR